MSVTEVRNPALTALLEEKTSEPLRAFFSLRGYAKRHAPGSVEKVKELLEKLLSADETTKFISANFPYDSSERAMMEHLIHDFPTAVVLAKATCRQIYMELNMQSGGYLFRFA